MARLRSIGASALESATRDNDIIGKSDDIASVMRRQFFSLFRICEMHVKNAPANDRFFPVEKSQQGSCQEFHTKKGLFERVRMKVIVGGPEHGIDNPITRQYVTRINKAWRSISFANMQFNPAKTIVDALKNTRKNSRKINIQVLTNGVNGKTCLGRRVQVMVSRRRYCLADTVCEYQRPKTIFHKKVAVFDGSHTVIGSYNLGKKSSGYDTEMVCVIKDKAVARSFEKVLREDVKQSKTLIRKEILRRKFGDTVLGSLVSFTERFL